MNGVPEGLGERGSALWTALGCDASTPRGALALEACRAADRLDDLDRVVRGKGVLQLLTFRLEDDFVDETGNRNVNIKVFFSGVLAEARQQQATFKALLQSFGVDKAQPAAPQKGSPLDELANRRASRGA